MPDASSPSSPRLSRRRACTHCTSAKAKCTPRTPTICERCQRLGKQCVYGPIAGTRRLPGETKNSGAARRVQRLESRVDSLVAQLDAVSRQRQQPQSVELVRYGSGSTPSSKSQDGVPLEWDSSRSELRGGNELETLHASSIHSETPSAEYYGDSVFDDGSRDLDRSEESLTIFRRDYFPEFPFILVSADETSESLRHHKPFLFLSIVAATSYTNPALQRRLAREIQKQIASRMIVNNEKSIDLLQGLLVYLAWYHYFFPQDGSSQILLLLQLCVTLVNEMGLTRDHWTRVATKCDEVVEAPAETGSSEKKPSLSELRAFLGTFYLCSSFSPTFGNLEIMGYSDYVHRCCKRLTKASHLESDQWVARLVEFEILVRRVSSTFRYSSSRDSKIRGEDSICAIVDGFERELENLQVAAQGDAPGRDLLTDEILGSTLSQMVNFVDAWIHEVAFHQPLWETQTAGATSAESQPLPNAQIHMLWQNLATSKRYFDDFMLVENGRLFHLTYVTWVRLSYMLAVCCKVVFCNVERQSPLLVDTSSCSAVNELSLPHHHHLRSRWDCLSAARKAGFQRIGGLIEHKIRSVGVEVGRDSDEKKGAMAQFAHCMSGITSSYERQLQAVSSKSKENNASAQIAVARLDTAPWNGPTTAESSPPQLSGQGTDNTTSELGWDIPMDFQADTLEDIVWESLMHDFTTLPQQ